MEPYLKRIKKYLIEFGVFALIKLILKYLSQTALNIIYKTLGKKMYSKITFPTSDIEVNVKFNNFFWKTVEKGKWELNCIKLLLKKVKNNQVIFDIGAWIGPYTLLASKLVDNNGKIFSFEPDPKAFDTLLENIDINKMNNVIAEKIGLSDTSGKAKFMIGRNGGNSGSSLIYIDEVLSFKEEIINLTTLDNYCRKNNLIPNGLIIDVEGAEELVIKGSREILTRYSPWVLMEFHGGFMKKGERKNNWDKIIDSAKEVIFIDGKSNQYQTGESLKELPDCENFHMFIQY